MRRATGKKELETFQKTSDYQVLSGVLHLTSSSVELFLADDDTALPSNHYVAYADFLIITQQYSTLVINILRAKGKILSERHSIQNGYQVMQHYIRTCIEETPLNPHIAVEAKGIDVYNDMRAAEMIVQVVADKIADPKLINFGKYWVMSLRRLIGNLDSDLYL